MRSKKLGFIEGWLSIGINTVLFILKLWAGNDSNSCAMTTDAWHTFSDSITSVVVLAGFFYVSKSPDKKHPYGHGRAESIAAIIIAVMLGFVGYGCFRNALNRLLARSTAQYTVFAIWVFAVSVFVKEALARFSIWAGNRIDSVSLKAEGWHHRSDAITTIILLAGVLLGKNLWWMDGVLGIIISLVLLYVTYDILSSVSSSIIGESPPEEMKQQINAIINQTYPDSGGYHHLHLHRYGDHAEVTFHMRFPSEMNLETAHEITNKIELALRGKMRIEATIHPEPRKTVHSQHN